MLSRRSVLVLGGAAIGMGALVAHNSRSRAATVMTPDEALAAAATGAILLVDIRRPDEWQATGVPEYAVPLDLREPDFVEKIRAARASATQPVAVICARGVRSARVTKELHGSGISPIVDIPEGMLGSFAGPGWLERGLPVVEVN